MNQSILSRFAVTLTLCGSLWCNGAAAQSTASEASGLSVVASVLVPAFFISESGDYVVKAVTASGQGFVYVLEQVGTGISGSVTIAANASGAASAGVGSAVRFSATSAGMLIISAGTVLAIIPNELGKVLMKSKKIS